jgi:uncharacterized membrane protein
MTRTGHAWALAAAILVSMFMVGYGQRIAPARALGAALLVLVLPGYAMTWAVFAGRAWGVAERMLLSLGVSLALAVISGLALNWTPWGLQTASWTLFLGGVALAATGLGALRRNDAHDRRNVHAVRVHRRDTALLLLATLLVVGAYGIAAYGATLRPVAQFTQLWMVPTDDQPRSVRIGFRNEEGSVLAYRLVLRSGVEVVQEWSDIRLASGDAWETVYALPTTQAFDEDLVASLYREDQPNAVYRYVTLRSQG